MKNSDVRDRLNSILRNCTYELQVLLDEMEDSGFDEYDLQGIGEAMQSLENVLLGTIDQFPAEEKKQKISM